MVDFNSDELSLDDIEALEALPEPAPSPKKRARKDPTADRSIKGWIALYHSFQHECEVPIHDEERPRRKGAHVEIEGKWVCRICFLSSLDKLDA